MVGWLDHSVVTRVHSDHHHTITPSQHGLILFSHAVVRVDLCLLFIFQSPMKYAVMVLWCYGGLSDHPLVVLTTHPRDGAEV
jgi:hypothetical protein